MLVFPWYFVSLNIGSGEVKVVEYDPKWMLSEGRTFLHVFQDI